MRRRDEDVRAIRSGRPARTFLIVAAIRSVVYAFDVAGAASAYLAPLVTLASVVAISVGARRNRPAPLLAWWLLLPISILCAAGISVRESTGQNVDLERSTILPDLLTVPGYLLFAVMVLVLIMSGRRGVQRVSGSTQRCSRSHPSSCSTSGSSIRCSPTASMARLRK